MLKVYVRITASRIAVIPKSKQGIKIPKPLKLVKLGLPVGFLLPWYSVLCTVESLPLLYFLLYLYLYVFGDDALIG